MGKTDVVRCDARGRVYLRGIIRQKYGEKFHVLEGDGELIFLPVPDDPVKALADLGKDLGEVSWKELRSAARKRAVKEALGNVRGH